MNNRELLQKAIEAGFDFEQCARVTASDGKEAVQIPRDLESLGRLEESTPSLESADNSLFHYWVVRAGM